MAFNGAGVYTPPAADFPAVANALIESAKFNNIVNDIATALTTCILKDGTQVVTANIPFGGFLLTGVGSATARTGAAALGQVQDATVNWVAAGGTVDAITATYSPVITALVDGQLCCFRASGANTATAPTFAPNGLTARVIYKKGGTALAAGDIPAANAEIILRYKLATTRWELLNPATGQVATVQALTDGASIAWDLSLGSVGTVTLGGNRTMAAPSNIVAGGHYVLHVLQDGTGGRTLAFNAVFKNQGGGATLPVPNGSLSTKTTYVFDSPNGTDLILTSLLKQQTRQVFTSGTAATYTTPTGCIRINVRMVGGGGGGGATATNNGATGVATTWSGGSLSAAAGVGGAAASGAPGAGGAATNGDINIPGGSGHGGEGTSNESVPGGQGGNGAFGGGGAAILAAAGGNGATNSGGGGSGGGFAGGAGNAGSGGGAGGYVEKLILTPAATYTYTVGTGGAGGAAGTLAGGNGAAGIIIVDEFYG